MRLQEIKKEKAIMVKATKAKRKIKRIRIMEKPKVRINSYLYYSAVFSLKRKPLLSV